MPTECLKRALCDTASALGWKLRTLVGGVLLLAFGKTTSVIRLGFEPAMTNLMDWVYTAVIPIAATALCFFMYNLCLAPLRLAREEIARQPKPVRKADITLYQGLDRYRLDEAACLWCGVEPENPVTDQRAKAMLVRLKHDYIDGKIQRHEDDGMHSVAILFTKLYGLRPKNSERATAIALRQYAESIGEVPEFLKSVQVGDAA